MKNGVPTNEICRKLLKKGVEVCKVKTPPSPPKGAGKAAGAAKKKAPIAKIPDDLKALKIKDLRDILHQRGLECKGCTEKSEFIAMLEKVRGQQEL